MSQNSISKIIKRLHIAICSSVFPANLVCFRQFGFCQRGESNILIAAKFIVRFHRGILIKNWAELIETWAFCSTGDIGSYWGDLQYDIESCWVQLVIDFYTPSYKESMFLYVPPSFLLLFYSLMIWSLFPPRPSGPGDELPHRRHGRWVCCLRCARPSPLKIKDPEGKKVKKGKKKKGWKTRKSRKKGKKRKMKKGDKGKK